MTSKRAQQGGVLVVAMITMLVAIALAFSAVSIATTDRTDLAREDRTLQARELAEAGVHRGIAFVQEMLRLTPAVPFAGLDQQIALDPSAGSGPARWLPTLVTTPDYEALEKNGRAFGYLRTWISHPDGFVRDAARRDVLVTATGYVLRTDPRLKPLAPGEQPLALSTVQAVVRFAIAPAPVFDYGYAIDNWGWFAGDTIHCYGNAATNGPFDAMNTSPGIFGTPRYDGIAPGNPAQPDLIGYRDDNHDGVLDGSDGGIYAGFDIANAGNVQGMGGLTENQHARMPTVPMPDLSDLTPYEADALASNSSLKLGGGVDLNGNPLPPIPVCNSILGDESGELENLVLIGTDAQPILLDGAVVVRGDVILKGVVRGKGSIYAGRNIYIADDVTYQDGPTPWRPADESEATTEQWLAANHDKDFLGLFAREHVVLGNYTDPTWQWAVDYWLQHPANQSVEDAGMDGIPDTAAGRDGVPGTEDDDLLEGDGVFTVERYTQAQADAGLLPAGKQVGDPIPGSGEDVDGDGQFDPTIALSEFDLSVPLDSAHWAGNLPPGPLSFGQISSKQMSEVQAAICTSHAVALVTLDTANPFNLVGNVASRVEALIYASPEMNLHHDRRLAGGGGGLAPLLPRALLAPRVIAWKRLDGDMQPVLAPTP